MDSPVKFDLSRVTYPGLLEIFAPIVPGGVLAIGTMLLSPPLVDRFFGYGGLGYRTKIFLAGLAAYIAGLMLQLLVAYITYASGYWVGSMVGNKTARPQPWNGSWWRQIARKFIGADLGPSADDLYFKSVEEFEMKLAIETAKDETDRLQRTSAVANKYNRLKTAEMEWYWWYQILNAYFTESTWHAPPAGYFLSMVHSAAWAVIVLMFSTHHHHWFAWVTCALGVLFGNFGGWFQGGLYGPDPYGVALASKILQALKTQAGQPGISDTTRGTKET